MIVELLCRAVKGTYFQAVFFFCLVSMCFLGFRRGGGRPCEGGGHNVHRDKRQGRIQYQGEGSDGR